MKSACLSRARGRPELPPSNGHVVYYLVNKVTPSVRPSLSCLTSNNGDKISLWMCECIFHMSIRALQHQALSKKIVFESDATLCNGGSQECETSSSSTFYTASKRSISSYTCGESSESCAIVLSVKLDSQYFINPRYEPPSLVSLVVPHVGQVKPRCVHEERVMVSHLHHTFCHYI